MSLERSPESSPEQRKFDLIEEILALKGVQISDDALLYYARSLYEYQRAPLAEDKLNLEQIKRDFYKRLLYRSHVHRDHRGKRELQDQFSIEELEAIVRALKEGKQPREYLTFTVGDPYSVDSSQINVDFDDSELSRLIGQYRETNVVLKPLREPEKYRNDELPEHIQPLMAELSRMVADRVQALMYMQRSLKDEGESARSVEEISPREIAFLLYGYFESFNFQAQEYTKVSSQKLLHYFETMGKLLNDPNHNFGTRNSEFDRDLVSLSLWIFQALRVIASDERLKGTFPNLDVKKLDSTVGLKVTNGAYRRPFKQGREALAQVDALEGEHLERTLQPFLDQAVEGEAEYLKKERLKVKKVELAKMKGRLTEFNALALEYQAFLHERLYPAQERVKKLIQKGQDIENRWHFGSLTRHKTNIERDANKVEQDLERATAKVKPLNEEHKRWKARLAEFADLFHNPEDKAMLWVARSPDEIEEEVKSQSPEHIREGTARYALRVVQGGRQDE